MERGRVSSTTKSFYDEDTIPVGVPKWMLCAQAVAGGYQARLIWYDEVAPMWVGETVHTDALDALDEAAAESARQIDMYCSLMESEF